VVLSLGVSKSWIPRGRRTSPSWFVGPWVVVGIMEWWWYREHSNYEQRGVWDFSIERQGEIYLVSRSFACQSSHIITYGHLDPNPYTDKKYRRWCRPLAELSGVKR